MNRKVTLENMAFELFKNGIIKFDENDGKYYMGVE